MGPGASLVIWGAAALIAWGISRYISTDSDLVKVDQDCDDDRGRYGRNASKTKIEKESDSSSSTVSALAVEAAVEASLPGFAWDVSEYTSNDSDHEARPHYDGDEEEDEEDDAIEFPNRYNPIYLQVTNSRSNTMNIMSYNVWSEEKYAIHERMKAIGCLVQLHSPHFICFQEITLNIYKIFQNSSWWGYYHCSVSEKEASEKHHFCILLSKYALAEISNTTLGYSNTKMGRLSVAKINLGNKSLVVASGHLNSGRPDNSDPKSKDHKFTKERKLQANDALSILKKFPNVIFCGDMNWDEKTDGEFPLPKGWIDAWTELRGKEEGYTFDTHSNKMLNRHGRVRKRLDRIFCKLKGKGFRVDNIDIIGKEALSDVTCKPKKKTLPVLPSDHYGLLLTISIYL